MRYLLGLLLCLSYAFCQSVTPAASQYDHYAIMLASANKAETGVMPMVTPERKLEFVPIPSIADSIKAGYSPIMYADLLRLIQQTSDENERLKTENERLWRVVEKTSGNPPTQVVVQQPPASDPNVDRRQMQMMVLRSLLVQRSTVNLNVRNCAALPALCAGQ